MELPRMNAGRFLTLHQESADTRVDTAHRPPDQVCKYPRDSPRPTAWYGVRTLEDHMMRSKPHAVILILLGACSDGTTPADGGADATGDTTTSDAQPDSDAGLDGDAAMPFIKPEALDQANKLALWL